MINMDPELETSNLKQTILKRIEDEQVCPRSAWFFSGRECVVWTLWVLTVLLGAVAVAVTLSVAIYRQHSLFEITHGGPFWFVLEVLPYLWMIIFIAMAIFAVFNLRHTKNGYRYPLWQILGSSLLMSMVGGAGLHLLGVGLMLDEQLGNRVEMYKSQIKMEQKMWQAPEAGRLVGTIILASSTEIQSGKLSFRDITGFTWEIDESELKPVEVDLLKSGNQIRLLGQVMPDSPRVFHVCGVLPWVYEKRYSANELQLFKTNMRKRMEEFEVVMNGPDLTLASTTSSMCAGTVFVRQMKQSGENRY